MMNREDKLYSMTGATLIQVADKLGVKVNCNKTRTALKEAKANVIERILAAEKAAEEAETAEIMQAKVDAGVEIMEINPEEVQIVEEVAEEIAETSNTETETAEVVDTLTDIINYIDHIAASNNMVYYVRDKQLNLRNYKINNQGAVVLLVSRFKKKVELHCKTRLLPENIYVNMIPVNHCFNRKYVITNLNDDVKRFISNLITNISDTKKNSN